MKKSSIYRWLLFDVVALAIIFVGLSVIRKDVVTDIFADKDDSTYSFTKSFVNDAESLVNNSLCQTIGTFREQMSTKLDRTEQQELSTDDDSYQENQTDSNLSSENRNEAIEMVVAGDVLFSASPLNKYDANGGITSILSKSLLTTLIDADINFINLEFPFSTRGTKMEDKQYTFRADPARCKILHEMGVDIVTLANNHILDFGKNALYDTLDTLKSERILSVGAGKTLNDAKKASTIVVKGKSVAFLGGSRKIPVHSWGATNNSAGVLSCYDPTLLCEEIKAAKQNHDFVVVYVHWGEEHQDIPVDYQRDNGKQYIDAGADIVIGSHPHVLQGIEYYNGKPIVYSLGNFVFGHTIDRTALLKVRIESDNQCSLQLIPCASKQAYTHELTDKKKIDEFYKYYQKISYGITINQEGEVFEK